MFKGFVVSLWMALMMMMAAKATTTTSLHEVGGISWKCLVLFTLDRCHQPHQLPWLSSSSWFVLVVCGPKIAGIKAFRRPGLFYASDSALTGLDVRRLVDVFDIDFQLSSLNMTIILHHYYRHFVTINVVIKSWPRHKVFIFILYFNHSLWNSTEQNSEMGNEMRCFLYWPFNLFRK